MGLTFNLGRVSPSVFTDSSLNVGIGAAPSGTYKLEVTGTAKVSSTLLVSGAATFSSSVSTGGALNITVPYSAGTMTILTQDNLGNGIYLAPRSNLNFDYGVANNTTGIINNFGYQNGSAHFRSLGIGDGKGGTIAFFDGVNSRVGIGTASPTSLLYLSQPTGNTSLFMKRVTNDTNFEISVQETRTRIRTWSTANDRDLYFDTDNAGTTRMIIKSGGDVQVNNALYWFGSDSKSYGFQQFADGYLSFVYLGFGVRATINGASGAYVAISDINVKKDFEDSTIGLSAIMSLKPTLFRFKDDLDNESQKELGFIAQQVKEFIPQAYQENGSFIGLQDRPIIAALVKAVQEQQAIITSLQDRLDKAGL
jgi:hypothetical protein